MFFKNKKLNFAVIKIQHKARLQQINFNSAYIKFSASSMFGAQVQITRTPEEAWIIISHVICNHLSGWCLCQNINKHSICLNKICMQLFKNFTEQIAFNWTMSNDCKRLVIWIQFQMKKPHFSPQKPFCSPWKSKSKLKYTMSKPQLPMKELQFPLEDHAFHGLRKTCC